MESPAKESSRPMRILLLGTGTPNPSLRRMGSGYLVTVGQDVILFDHGPGAFQRLFESGISLTRVSHLHYDHCYGFRLDSPEGSFAYSGDAGQSPEFINLARHCDVLIHMCHQISGTSVSQEWIKGAAGHMEVAAIGAEANVKNLVVSHIPSQMDVPGIRERLIIEMAEIFKGNIIWGEDLMEISLTAPEPANHTG